MQLRAALPQLGVPKRPWYPTQHTVSFADILRLAQRTLAAADWGTPRALLAYLRPTVHLGP